MWADKDVNATPAPVTLTFRSSRERMPAHGDKVNTLDKTYGFFEGVDFIEIEVSYVWVLMDEGGCAGTGGLYYDEDEISYDPVSHAKYAPGQATMWPRVNGGIGKFKLCVQLADFIVDVSKQHFYWSLVEDLQKATDAYFNDNEAT